VFVVKAILWAEVEALLFDVFVVFYPDIEQFHVSSGVLKYNTKILFFFEIGKFLLFSVLAYCSYAAFKL
jgi:hypothetical protein